MPSGPGVRQQSVTLLTRCTPLVRARNNHTPAGRTRQQDLSHLGQLNIRGFFTYIVLYPHPGWRHTTGSSPEMVDCTCTAHKQRCEVRAHKQTVTKLQQLSPYHDM